MSNPFPHLRFAVPIESLLPMLQALHTVHSDQSSNPARMQAQQQLEMFKSTQPVDLLMQTSLALLSCEQDPSFSQTNDQFQLPAIIVRHFALHLQSALINTKWNSIDQASKQLIKQRCLTMISSPQTINDKVAINQSAAIIKSLVFREWPQQWPDLMENLISINNQSNQLINQPLNQPISQALNGLNIFGLIIGDIAEEVVTNSMPEQRRKELQNGLIVQMDPIFATLLSNYQTIVNHSISQSINQSHPHFQPLRSCLIVQLNAIKALLDWIPVKYIFDTGLLQTISQSINQNVLSTFEALCDLIGVIVAKKPTTLDSNQSISLFSMFDRLITSVEQLLGAAMFESKWSYMSHVLNSLTTLTTTHTLLLVNQSNNQSNITTRLFTVLGQLLALSSINQSNDQDLLCTKLSLDALQCWVFLFRHHASTLIRPVNNQSNAQSLMIELFKIICTKLQKNATIEDIQSANQQSANQSLQPAKSESHESALQMFGVMRGQLLQLFSAMVELDAPLCMQLVCQRYEQLLTAPPPADSVLDCLNANGYVTTATPRFMELESTGSLLETLFRVCHSVQFASTLLGSLGQQLFAAWLNYVTDDPLLQTRRLHALSLLTPIYTWFEPTLQPACNACLQGITFVPSKEQPALNEAINQSANQTSNLPNPLMVLTEDARACRRRAIHSLIHIAKRVSKRFSPIIVQTINQSITVLKSAQLLDTERILLIEFIILISQSINQSEQSNLIEQLLQPAQQALQSPEMNNLISQSNNQLINLLMQENGGTRHRLLHHINTYLAVFKGVLSASPSPSDDDQSATPTNSQSPAVPHGGANTQSSNHPALVHLFSAIPTICRLLRAVFTLRTPAFIQSINPTPDQTSNNQWLQTALMAGSLEELGLMLIPAHTIEQSLNQSNKQSVINDLLVAHFPRPRDVRRWLDSLIELCLQLIGLTCKSGRHFYSTLALDVLIDSLIVPIESLHPHEFRFVLEKVWGPFFLYCPSDLYQPIVSLAATRLLPICTQRFIQQYSKQSSNKSINRTINPSNDIRFEIYDENQWRECARAFVDMFSRIANDYDLNHDAVNGKEHLPLSACEFFIHCLNSQSSNQTNQPIDQTLPFLFLHGLTVCVGVVDDSQTRSKAIRLMLRLVPLAAHDQALHPALIDCLIACLQTLATMPKQKGVANQSVNQIEMDLCNLVTSIYLLLLKTPTSIGQVQSILLQVDGVTQADLQTIETTIQQAANQPINQPNNNQAVNPQDKTVRQQFRSLINQKVIGRLNSISAIAQSNGQTGIENLPNAWNRVIVPKVDQGAVIEHGSLTTLFQ